MNYSIELLILSLTIVLFLLLLYLQRKDRFAIELRGRRERLGRTQFEMAEILSILWNKEYPDNKKEFDERTIRRWEARIGPSTKTRIRMQKVFNGALYTEVELVPNKERNHYITIIEDLGLNDDDEDSY